MIVGLEDYDIPDGASVCLTTDITDDVGNVYAVTGSRFTWDASCDHQHVNGEILYVTPDEVEVID